MPSKTPGTPTVFRNGERPDPDPAPRDRSARPVDTSVASPRPDGLITMTADEMPDPFADRRSWYRWGRYTW